MALRNLIVCINAAGGKNDLPCVILHSPSRDVTLNAARSILNALRPNGPSRSERHVLPAVDPGRHSTCFDYERAPTSLMIDFSQSDVARSSAFDWVAPIAATRHIQGVRRSIVLHCADLLSWSHQNALKNVIESSQSNTLFILTTSQASALQCAIVSRGVVIRCPTQNAVHPAPNDMPSDVRAIMGFFLQEIGGSTTHVTLSKAARYAASTLSRLYHVSNQPSCFLRILLECLIEQMTKALKLGDVRDSSCCDIVRDMMSVDLQLAAVFTSNKGTTLTIALHRALLGQAMRLRDVLPALKKDTAFG